MKIFKNIIISFITFSVLLLSFSCSKHSKRTISRGFYYWKTNFAVSNFEQSILDSVGASYIYVRFFDVDKKSGDKMAKPIAIINFDKKHLPSQQIIPVIFITPRALNSLSWTTLDFFAKNIATLLARKSNEIMLHAKEIQIDCDWTSRNKGLYFALLKKLQKQAFFKGKTISVTIRLHQVKYPALNGVPPVKKGVLMVYNMDKLTDFNVSNSIITIKTAKKYLETVDNYPLPLDIALPIYSWALLFNRSNGHLLGILRNISHNDLQNNTIFQKEENNKYIIKKDIFFKDYHLKSNELIRFESAHFKTVSRVAQYLSSRLKTDSLRILLYHCDSLNFKNFPANEMEKIFSDFN